jgi:hypothetical protein
LIKYFTDRDILINVDVNDSSQEVYKKVFEKCQN